MKEKEEVKKTVKEDGIRKNILIMRKVSGKTKSFLELTDEGADYISQLASWGCTIEEICIDIGVSEPTMYKPHNKQKFKDAITRGQANYSMSIRQQNMRILKGGKGNAHMAIFLSKAVLHMSDQVAPQTPAVSPLDELSKAIEKYKDEE